MLWESEIWSPPVDPGGHRVYIDGSDGKIYMYRMRMMNMLGQGKRDIKRHHRTYLG